MDRLEEDHDNLRTAIQWALQQGDMEIALRLTASAAHLWYPRGYLTEGRRRLEAALAGTAGSPAARAKALTEVGWFAVEQSDYDQGQKSLEESQLVYQELGDKYGVAHALECLSVAKMRLGDYGRAAQLQEDGLALYRELDHKWGIAMSLSNLGVVAQEQGEYERATTLHLESLALLRVVGDALTMGCVLNWLAQVFLVQGQLERSAQLLEESQSLLRQLGDKLTLAETLRDLGETVLRQGDGTRAAAVYKEGLALAAEVGSKTIVAGCLEGLAAVVLIQGQPARAVRLRGAAEALREGIGAVLWPVERSYFAPHTAAAIAELGEAAWEAALVEGRAMTQQEAIDYALKPPAPDEEPSSSSKPQLPAGLSSREVEVLRLVARGMTNAQIAQELFISPRTVNGHLTSAYHKIGSHSRAEATRFALERGLLL
jgi:DNA-binding CsgD family transcriptional regulator